MATTKFSDDLSYMDNVRKVDILQNDLSLARKTISELTIEKDQLFEGISKLDIVVREKEQLLKLQKELIEIQRDTISAQKEHLHLFELNLRRLVEEGASK